MQISVELLERAIAVLNGQGTQGEKTEVVHDLQEVLVSLKSVQAPEESEEAPVEDAAPETAPEEESPLESENA